MLWLTPYFISLRKKGSLLWHSKSANRKFAPIFFLIQNWQVPKLSKYRNKHGIFGMKFQILKYIYLANRKLYCWIWSLASILKQQYVWYTNNMIKFWGANAYWTIIILNIIILTVSNRFATTINELWHFTPCQSTQHTLSTAISVTSQ